MLEVILNLEIDPLDMLWIATQVTTRAILPPHRPPHQQMRVTIHAIDVLQARLPDLTEDIPSKILIDW